MVQEPSYRDLVVLWCLCAWGRFILMGWTQPSLLSTASEWARMVSNHHDEERGRIQDEGLAARGES